MECDIWVLLGYALTGCELPIDSPAGPEELLAALEGAGWPAQRVRDQAYSLWEQEQPWPYPLPPDRIHQVNAAQWYAILGQVRTLLGLDVVHLPPSHRTTLTADERRLLADLPPHHGLVG